ncbi:hypothetical protein DSCO28_16900 [Desulfosarcina ovata subsp. sediminis]|uniref:Uncharacterized protein n=1 Tax=Desulfosarcina ovata subsp. sediminis TaxID=885957 RepID=A0A5K7ZIC3_9BACT|nr:hypothetical protein [Desulfosarcina ovata]BBO81124.1 hypothetical protein DSCO28_16900 [Desulfosarcina ovata subsp. sediminis]
MVKGEVSFTLDEADYSLTLDKARVQVRLEISVKHFFPGRWSCIMWPCLQPYPRPGYFRAVDPKNWTVC